MRWDEAIRLLECDGQVTYREKKAIIKLLEHGKKAMLALESLTPQGSEFYNDIEYCVAHVRERQTQAHETIKRLVNEKKFLKQSLLKLTEGKL